MQVTSQCAGSDYYWHQFSPNRDSNFMATGKRKLLQERLNAIGASLARTGNGLALIGLGSGGLELDRLDQYSDLDFFAIVETGHKNEYLENLEWLSSICPIAFSYRNTRDGYKLLFQDAVFCEFAVFETAELRHIPFAPGRIVWQKDNIPEALLLPEPDRKIAADHSIEWLVGEVLTNLYSGVSRNNRGEKLSAMRFIQVYAVDRLLELSARFETGTSVARDIFAFERRFEQRYPASAQALPEFVQGYERNIESAQAILTFLESRFEVNPAMKEAIENLCSDKR
jgi:lincosamide nucleotidyltransferase